MKFLHLAQQSFLERMLETKSSSKQPEIVDYIQENLKENHIKGGEVK